jgi:hypothetical protein
MADAGVQSKKNCDFHDGASNNAQDDEYVVSRPIAVKDERRQPGRQIGYWKVAHRSLRSLRSNVNDSVLTVKNRQRNPDQHHESGGYAEAREFGWDERDHQSICSRDNWY